jgi:hypothetical protein
MKKSNEKENKNNQEKKKSLWRQGKKRAMNEGEFLIENKVLPTNKTHNKVHWWSNPCICGCWVILALEWGLNWSLTIGFGPGQ